MITLSMGCPASPHLQQLDRVRRYHARIEAVSTGKAATRHAEELVDDVYSFFMHCYHLKDWLIKDPSYTKHNQRQIEDYITATPELALCADLCNASKHLVLDRPPRTAIAPSVNRQDMTVVFEDHVDFRTDGSPSTVETILRIEFEHNGKAVDALDLADRALKAWEWFIV